MKTTHRVRHGTLRSALLLGLAASTVFLTEYSSHAQGTITFANSAGTMVRFAASADVPVALQDQPVPTGSVDPYGAFNVALYWFNGSSFEQVGAAVPIGPVAGRFSGGTRTVIGLGGGISWGTFLVRAWSGGSRFSSYEAARVSADSSIVLGESSTFTNATYSYPSTPGPAAPFSGFPGMTVRPLPEPSTPVLGALGIVALVAHGLRRRRGSC